VRRLIEKVFKLFSTKYALPAEERLSVAIRALGARDRLVLSFLVVVFAASGITMLWQVNKEFLTEVPDYGGSFAEGLIGSPRFINPLLASSDTDRDLTELVYSGLMRVTGSGTLVPDLAKSYTVSDDGLIYTFTLKDNIVWHDGEPITADDVVFTFTKVQDTTLRSPKRASWDGVTAQKIDDRTIRLALSKPYAPFIENATLGILPHHIWGNVDSDQFVLSKFNTEPIGSGPYKVSGIKSDGGGIPVLYTLKPFQKFTLGKPYIKQIELKFYPTEERLVRAFEKGDISAMGSISPEVGSGLAEEEYRVESSALPRVFGVFFNQNKANIFTEKAVRDALNAVIDKKIIIDEVLHGYGTIINGPIPPGSIGYMPPEKDTLSKEGRMAMVGEILDEGGWELDEETGVRIDSDGNELRFSLSTSAVPELKSAAELLAKMWGDIGAIVDVKVFEPGSLNQAVIRPREYDALLFGEIIGRDSDPFAFWHSSQRLDPGLNIALYTNITVDKLLEEARSTTDTQIRKEKYELFSKEIANDVPAIFLYAPDFIYVFPQNVRGLNIGAVTVPSERFSNVYEWYIKTDHVWKFLVN